MSRIGKVREWVKEIGDHVNAECKVAFVYDTESDSFSGEIHFKDENMQNGTLRVDFERSDFTPQGYHKFLDKLSEQVKRFKK